METSRIVWFYNRFKYMGDYTRADLTQENLVEEVVVVISEINNDSPLLYAWVRACELLWDRGLWEFLQQGRWHIVYQPSHF